MSARPKILNAIRCATLAPSGHNAQPWTFVMEEDGVALFPDLSRRLPVADPHDRELYAGLGAALENLVIAARHEGLAPRVEYFPAAHPSALMVHFGGGVDGAADGDADLFRAIAERQSTRRAFDRRPIPTDQLAVLERAARRDRVWVHLITAPGQIDAIAAMAQVATRTQLRDRTYREELIAWIRFNKKEAARQPDGLTHAVLGRPQVRRWFGSAMLRAFPRASREGKRAGAMIRSASSLMVFASEAADPSHCVDVGRSFERVALTATALGIRHAHANAVCEVVEFRRQLQAYLGLGSAQPVILIRLGYARARPRSPRRSIEDVVLRRPVAASGIDPERA